MKFLKHLTAPTVNAARRAARPRRHDRAAVAGVAVRVGRGAGSRAAPPSRRCAWPSCSPATASTSRSGGRKAKGANMELGKVLQPLEKIPRRRCC